MRRNFLASLLAAALLCAGAGHAMAQDGEPAGDSDQAKPADDGADAAPADDSGDAKADQAKSGDAKSEGDETAKDDAAADGKPAEDGEKGDQKQKLGPGGKPLRTDYPGTDESLEPRMDTDKIEGLQVDPNKPEAAYGLRIRELETKIDDLKEKVFQSKTRIVLLRETLLSGNLAGARAIIIHKTSLGSVFKLKQALYSLDGTRIYSKMDKDGNLSDKRTFEVYNGSVSPGNHTLSIFLKYRGTNVGLFPYFKGYSGDIRSSCEFKAQEGKISQVKVETYNAGGVATSVEQRPNVRCEVQFFDNVRKDEKGKGKGEGGGDEKPAKPAKTDDGGDGA